MGLSAYAKVLLADRKTEKRADDIVEGDELWDAFAKRPAKVTKVWQGPAVGMHRISAGGSRVVDLTGDHLVLTENGLIKANAVRVGLQILAEGGAVRCAETLSLFGDYMVYDFVTEGSEAAKPVLFANGLAVGS